MRTPPGSRPPMRRWDANLAGALYGVALLAGAGAAFFAMLLPMYTDSCMGDCDDSAINRAILVCWVVIAVALGSSLWMMVAASRKGRYMWFWPLLAIVAIAGAFVAANLVAVNATS